MLFDPVAAERELHQVHKTLRVSAITLQDIIEKARECDRNGVASEELACDSQLDDYQPILSGLWHRLNRQLVGDELWSPLQIYKAVSAPPPFAVGTIDAVDDPMRAGVKIGVARMITHTFEAVRLLVARAWLIGWKPEANGYGGKTPAERLLDNGNWCSGNQRNLDATGTAFADLTAAVENDFRLAQNRLEELDRRFNTGSVGSGKDGPRSGMSFCVGGVDYNLEAAGVAEILPDRVAAEVEMLADVAARQPVATPDGLKLNHKTFEYCGKERGLTKAQSSVLRSFLNRLPTACGGLVRESVIIKDADIAASSTKDHRTKINLALRGVDFPKKLSQTLVDETIYIKWENVEPK
jgi:hypothetical protein